MYRNDQFLLRNSYGIEHFVYKLILEKHFYRILEYFRHSFVNPENRQYNKLLFQINKRTQLELVA